MTETLPFDGGRDVTVYIPTDRPTAVMHAADGGWHTGRLAGALEAAGSKSTAIVGVHGLDDDDARLQEYVESFGGHRFHAFEEFFVHEVRAWVRSELGVAPVPGRTAIWGASLGGELAMALGLRHPDVYGTILCASPGGGFGPPDADLTGPIPRTYLVGGREEPWFLDNARRWADALGAADADVVIEERTGEHGGSFWYDELPLMVAWAFAR